MRCSFHSIVRSFLFGEPRCVSPRILPKLSTYNSLKTTLCRFGPPSDSSLLSVLPSSAQCQIWCHSLIKFDRVRPFLVIHRLFAAKFLFFQGVRVCSTSFEFDAVRIHPYFFGEPRCVSPRTLPKLPTHNSLKTTFCRFCPPSDTSSSSVLLPSCDREICC